MATVFETDEILYALLLTPRYDKGRMQVQVGMAIPQGVDEEEEAVMTHALMLLYAAFDMMNSDDDFLNKINQRAKELSEQHPMEDDTPSVAAVPTKKEYLDEARKVVKLDFSSPTKGRA